MVWWTAGIGLTTRRALELTAEVTRAYAGNRQRPSADAVFPLRVALSVFTAVTMLVIRVPIGDSEARVNSRHSALFTCNSHEADKADDLQ
jgi:hypothetical protein